MKFETGYGEIDLPKFHCIFCIYRNEYMGCTACEFKETLIKNAAVIVNKMNEELNS